MAGNEKPCIYKHTCGFEICMMSECPYYIAKTKGRKWAEQEEEDENRSELQKMFLWWGVRP